MGRRYKIVDSRHEFEHPALAANEPEASLEKFGPRLIVQEVPVSLPADAETAVAEWSTNAGVTLVGYRAGGFGWIVARGLASYRFSVEGPVIGCPDGGDESRIQAVWLSSVLPLVVQARGTQVLHASAVAGGNGIVALCGASGAGKSTLAGALMQRGHQLVADDALPFHADGARAVGHPLPFSLRLRAGSAAMLEIDERSLPTAPAATSPLKALAILNPSMSDATSASFATRHPLSPDAPGELVRGLLPHLYCFSLEESKEKLIREVFALVRAVPVLRLDYEQRPERLAAACDALEGLLDG